MDALVFESVIKRYKGEKKNALNGLSFRFPKGKICGLVGPNGAGKTTSFSIIGGFLQHDEGTVNVLGEGAFDPRKFIGRVGLLPQDAPLGGYHTPYEWLHHLGCLQGFSSSESAREAERLIEKFDLADNMKNQLRKLSHGVRRRVAVAMAFVGNPELVLLDEPMAGLDPIQKQNLREWLRSLGEDVTLVVSSHDLPELEQICDWIVMLDHGQCVRQGSIGDFTEEQHQMEWTLGDGTVPMEKIEQALPEQRVILLNNILRLYASSGAELEKGTVTVMAILASAGIPIRGVHRGVRLEEQFFSDAITGESEAPTLP